MTAPLLPDYLPPETRMLPVQWAIAGHGVPDMCSRHGLPQSRRIKMKVESDPPAWVYAMLLFGVLPFFLAAAATTTKVKLKSWPVCKQCVKLRRLRMLGGVGMFALTLAVCVSGAAVPNSPQLQWVVMLAVVGLFIGGVAVLVTSEYARVTRTKLTTDGRYLDVKKAAPAFEAAIAQAHIAAQTTSAWAGQRVVPGSKQA